MADEVSATTERTAIDYEELADALRSRMDLFGKSVAGIATLGTGAVGLATVSDLSPRGWPSLIAALAAVAALLIAAWGAIRVAQALIQVNQPMVMEPDERVLELTDAERTDVDRIFQDTAARFGLFSLVGLQERESALRQAASRASTEAERVRRTALADESRAAIDQALARARWALVRRRSAEATGGRQAFVSYLLVATGLLGFALLSDTATANQSDNIATAKACADAREAGATSADLDDTTCTEDEAAAPEDPSPVSADTARATLVLQLTESLLACQDLVSPEGEPDPARPLTPADCAPLEQAITALVRE